jgi:hypothetical protein
MGSVGSARMNDEVEVLLQKDKSMGGYGTGQNA